MPPFCCSLATATPATPCGTLRRQARPRRPNRAWPFLVRPRLTCQSTPCLSSHANQAMPAVPHHSEPEWPLHTSPRLPSRSRYCRSPPSGPCLLSLVIRYRVPHRHAIPATPWCVNPLLPRLPVQAEPSPAIAASPAAPFLSVPTKPCQPCHLVHWAQSLPTVPCLPTHANSVLSPPRHACAAVLCIARPRLASLA